MRFDSQVFLLFLACVAGVSALLPRRKWQNALLVGASYGFYGWIHPWFCWLLLASTTVDFLAALGMDRAPAQRRLLLGVSLATNLGLLATFKYLDFLMESAAAALATVGWNVDPFTLGVVLPVGISFYTFQSMGYTIDVYRGRTKPCRNPVDFALFVSFFPQLVAGPIERASRLLPQLEAHRPPRWKNAMLAAPLLLRGFTLKLVVADNLAPRVEKVFSAGDPSVLLVATGALIFGAQLLADFSGYTDIARGSARLLGIDLVENFRAPYAARSPSDYWRRWHISMSQWFRDYVYIPLGGSRQPSAARFAGAMGVTMGLAGLWHGAAWTFVAFGLVNGVALFVGHRIGWNAHWVPAHKGQAALGHLGTLFVIFVSLAIFRAPSLSWLAEAVGTAPRPSDWLAAALLLSGGLLFSLFWGLEALCKRANHPALHAAFSAACLAACFVLSPGLRGDFLYFRF
jgi:alginate O-acetyltransferase complex protein AlgI